MKKGLLILFSMLAISFKVGATNSESTNQIRVTTSYNSIRFIERGIEFHIFLNGEFDFNTHNNQYYDYNGRRSRRSYGVKIKRDYRGRIRSVGNVFINYDYRGNVKRIGSVFIQYRRGRLTRVGHLKIKYSRWGNVYFYGTVKKRMYRDYYYEDDFYQDDFDDCDVYDYDDEYFYRGNFNRKYRKFKEDQDFYYYRAKPNGKKLEKRKVLKRKKLRKNAKKRYEKRELEKNSSRRKRRI